VTGDLLRLRELSPNFDDVTDDTLVERADDCRVLSEGDLVRQFSGWGDHVHHAPIRARVSLPSARASAAAPSGVSANSPSFSLSIWYSDRSSSSRSDVRPSTLRKRSRSLIFAFKSFFEMPRLLALSYSSALIDGRRC
jgi:hypothetical protein